MKNIFIEGIQGMGKSTLLNAILAEIPRYHVCREGDYSPVELGEHGVVLPAKEWRMGEVLAFL